MNYKKYTKAELIDLVKELQLEKKEAVDLLECIESNATKYRRKTQGLWFAPMSDAGIANLRAFIKRHR